ncbi:hypothetical protein HUU53_01245 [Candidatus Micrarchaeota archaeon]|nr:hypothetical protein [Candidatus Micrarchaeota archaeon]
MKKVFLTIMFFALFASAVEQQAMLVTLQFTEAGLVFEKAEYGYAELPDYSLPQEHFLVLKYLAGSNVLKEIKVPDSRYKTAEVSGDTGQIITREFFIPDQEIHLVLPVITGSCIISVFEGEKQLTSFNYCTSARVQQPSFIPYTNLKPREAESFVLAASIIVSILLGGLVLKRMRSG